ncbi:ABC transporter substrate-binding protein [Terasakiella sp. A23]|uniref:substrate-binding periplasmic protein n=1 Tax=Terasakiella sp. FCG-A23 TaxID=3080561 RepID=UPI0029558C59|nr:ABC transporter substrate-binding protein [Terasakiella sp. A23]MDV7338127.1 ABC transporter substrate-binding protein [Terasakiella sp. A23]
MKLFRIFCILTLLVLSSPAFADKKIALVTGEDYAPFTDPNLPKDGLATAVVNAAFKAVGYKTEIFWKPWKRGYIESKNAQFIGTFPYIPTAERRADFLYSEPIFTETYVALSNMSEKADFKLYEDMKGRTICRPIGYAIADKFEKFRKAGEISLFQPSDMQSCLRTITTLKKHVVVLNRQQFMDHLKKDGVDATQIKVHHLDEKGFSLHFIVSRRIEDAQNWIDQFNLGLQSIRTSGLYDNLSQEFGLKP